MRLVLILLAFINSWALASAYDNLILADNPVLYLPLSASSSSAFEPDLSGGGHAGRYLPAGSQPVKERMPNGDFATIFNGTNQYVQIASNRKFSVRPGGALTIEAWIRPDVLSFRKDEGDGYVHWAGKGEPGQHEYVMRMYSYVNTANPPRPNRISGYAFNLNGGLGSGSYFQDAVTVGQWIHVAMVIQTRTRPGTVSIFKNGVLRKTTSLAQFDVTPGAGNAPVRIGTRDFGSFFQGAIGKFAIYAYPLSAARLRAHFERM